MNKRTHIYVTAFMPITVIIHNTYTNTRFHQRMHAQHNYSNHKNTQTI